MKIKILLAPSLIVIIIIMVIWYIYPAYFGVDGISDKRQKMADQKLLMEKLDTNVNNVKKLGADLDANAMQNSIVFDYIPKNKEEEKIIENLNSQATNSALAVLGISVAEDTETASAADVSTLSVAPPVADPVAGTVSAPVEPKLDPKKLKVKLSVVGDYANIKLLLAKIQKLKRFNNISGLEIKTLMTENQEVSNSLQADMTLEFNYFSEPKRLTAADLGNDVFSTGNFDTQVIDKIRASRNVDVNNVEPGQKRGNNPFIIAK